MSPRIIIGVCIAFLVTGLILLHHFRRIETFDNPLADQTFIRNISTSLVYYDAGLKHAFPVIRPEDVQFAVSANDVICTFFQNNARKDCRPVYIDNVTMTSKDECPMVDARFPAPSSPKNALVNILGSQHVFVRRCVMLPLSGAGIVNTNKQALQYFLSRPLFCRLPFQRLMSCSYPSSWTYTWPTAAHATDYSGSNQQMFSLSHLDPKTATQIDRTKVTNSPTITSLIRQSRGEILETPATIYCIQPSSQRSKQKPSIITIRGRTEPRMSFARLGDLVFHTRVTANSRFALQIDQSDSKVFDVSTPLPISLPKPEPFQYVLSLAKSGGFMFMAVGTISDYVVFLTGSIAPMTVLPDLLGSTPFIPDFWAEYQRITR